MTLRFNSQLNPAGALAAIGDQLSSRWGRLMQTAPVLDGIIASHVENPAFGQLVLTADNNNMAQRQFDLKQAVLFLIQVFDQPYVVDQLVRHPLETLLAARQLVVGWSAAFAPNFTRTAVLIHYLNLVVTSTLQLQGKTDDTPETVQAFYDTARQAIHETGLAEAERHVLISLFVPPKAEVEAPEANEEADPPAG